VAALASEYRQRVHDQLAVIAPGEFKPRVIGVQDRATDETRMKHG
jgi:predicted ATP-dependent Lon-type protease